jgi:hypothetical protein
MIIVGTVISTLSMQSGNTRTEEGMIHKYNNIESALEEGKAALIRYMDSPVLPRYFPKSGITEASPITSVEDLLIASGDAVIGVVADRTLAPKDLRKMGINGKRGRLTVKIYDMRYDASLINVPQEEIDLIPTAMNISGGGAGDYDEENPYHAGDGASGTGGTATNAGAYLVRVCVYASESGNEKDMKLVSRREQSIIQTNRPGS